MSRDVVVIHQLIQFDLQKKNPKKILDISIITNFLFECFLNDQLKKVQHSMHTSSRLTFCNKTQQHQLFTINLKHRMNAQYFMLIYIDDHNMDSDWSIKRNIR